WRPTPRVRQHRSLVRRRAKIQSRITSIKNTTRGLVTRYNADRQDLFCSIGWQETMQLKFLEQDRWLLEDLHDDLDQNLKRLEKLDAKLASFALTAGAREAEAR